MNGMSLWLMFLVVHIKIVCVVACNETWCRGIFSDRVNLLHCCFLCLFLAVTKEKSVTEELLNDWIHMLFSHQTLKVG